MNKYWPFAISAPIALLRSPFVAPLVAALGLRLLVWWLLPYHLPNLVPIGDEGEYRAAAIWLANGRNFSFFKEWIWTRPPVYLLFLATHIALFGPVTLIPIRLSQAVLSTISVGLVMLLALRLAPPLHARRVTLLAGWATALSYSLASYSFLLLSETLFITLLLAALLALTWWAQAGRWRWLIVGGLLLGLGALTRAMLAGALPLIAGWVWWQAWGRTHGPGRSWRSLIAPAVLTVVVSALILPWSVYNTRFFAAQSLILIDTTGGYNAMLGAQAAHLDLLATQRCAADPAQCGPAPARNEELIYAALIREPDHSQRQALAYRTAAAWFAENPAGFAAKTGRELFDLVLINVSGAEQLFDGYTKGYTPIPHTLGLVSDYVLYVLALPLAILGLFRRQVRAGKGLILIWLGYNLITGPLFFAINRFRLPLLPFLLIFAACALVAWRDLWPSLRRRSLAMITSGLVLLVLLDALVWWPPVLRTNPDQRAVLRDVWLALRSRSIARTCDAATATLNQGDVVAAQALVDRGVARQPLPCFALVQARIWAVQGNPSAALDLLKTSAASGDTSLNAARVVMLEADLRRAQGERETARGLFAARSVDTNNDQRWAWHNLTPPPTTRIEPGHGLDLGLIDGFGGREKRDERDPFGSGYRWTGPIARLKFVAAGTGQPQTLRLRVNGSRPAGEPAATITIMQHNQTIGTATTTGDWSTLSFTLAPTAAGQDVIITLTTNVFVPSPRDDRRNPLRLRGVQMDWAEVSAP